MSIFKKVLEFVMDILETITFVGSIFIVVYLFIMQPHQVRGASMDTTFKNGQYILTNKLAYRIGTFRRGDVVVFDSPENVDIDFIKRIVGLPGDTVRVEGGKVILNGKPLNEPYLDHVTTMAFDGGFLAEGEDITVPEGYLFVMGDNRPRSSDSRSFGPVQQKHVVGRVFFRYFPVDKFGPIKNPFVK
jgi:signal peptidase I